MLLSSGVIVYLLILERAFWCNVLILFKNKDNFSRTCLRRRPVRRRCRRRRTRPVCRSSATKLRQRYRWPHYNQQDELKSVNTCISYTSTCKNYKIGKSCWMYRGNYIFYKYRLARVLIIKLTVLGRVFIDRPW